MKKLMHSLTALAAISTFGVAGGDLAPIPVTVYEETSSFLENVYLGLGIGYARIYSVESAWFTETESQDEEGTLGVVAGYDFNQYIAVEGRFTKSVFEQDYGKATTYSIFVKPQYPVSEDFSVYALLGLGNTTVKATAKGGDYFGAVPSIVGNTLMDETGFQWGLGANYAVTEEVKVFVDYVSYALDANIDPTPLFAYGPNARFDELSVDALTIGVTYTF